MIVKGDGSNNKLPWAWIIAILLCLFVVYQFLTRGTTFESDDRVIYCDAETTSGGKFISRQDTFNNGRTQTSKESRSGRYSSFLDGDHKYGMSYRLANPAAGQKYIASVWRKTEYPNNAKLVIKQSPNQKKSAESSFVVRKDANGWEQIEVSMVIPVGEKVDELIVFCYMNKDGTTAYFDDLTIEQYSPGKGLEGLDKHLHIYLDKKALDKINAKRDIALKRGLLESSDDDWVKAKMTADDSLEYDVKLRLKGDWTDHLTGDYWSYRIKMPSDQSWNRLMTFSLQDPMTRDYLSEWLYHQVLNEVDVITPRYGFVKLSQNNQEPVLYAYEEHFEKQVAEYRDRREGVILKYAEDAFWAERGRNLGSEKINFYRGGVDNAEVVAFKESKIAKTPKLLEQYDHGRGLLKGYQEQSLPASEIFDVDRMARLYAVAEVLEAYHGLIWHNQRFYYNPVTRKLEPIGFDGFTESGPYRIYNKLFFGEHKTGPGVVPYYAHYVHLFKDRKFNEAYVKYMLEYASEEWIYRILDKYQEELMNYEFLIQKSRPSYQFKKEDILERAKLLRQNIVPYNDYSLQAFSGMSTDPANTIQVANMHALPLEIIGSGVTRDKMDATFKEANFLYSGPLNGAPVYSPIQIASGHKFLFFRLAGAEEIYSTTVKKWTSPQLPAVRYSSTQKPVIPLSDNSFSIANNKITIKAGNHQLSEPIIVPENFMLVIEPGTTIDLIQKAYILSYGAVIIEGTESDPIMITSTDKSSQGFVVSQATVESAVSYTSFTQLNTLEENEWQMTGAVTFYESDVKLDHVTISENSCEDALNIVRSQFDISYLNINNTFADGFDGDFCKGTISESYFYRTGNDGLDYSGSVVTVKNVRLVEIGDKGISAGEQATLIVRDVEIDGAEIGIASKDLSQVTVSGLTMKNCAQGFAAYRKKPEFGGGTINVSSFTSENVTKLTISDDESKITLPK